MAESTILTEIAADNLEFEAQRFAATIAAVRTGDASQALLRSARAHLFSAACAYATATHGPRDPAA